MSRELELNIGGQRIKVKTDEDEAYMRRLAGHVDERMRELGHGQRGVTSLNVALLAALRIADELYKTRDDSSAAEAVLQLVADEVEGALDGTGS